MPPSERRRPRVRTVVALLALALVVLGAWCAYRALQVRSDLNAAKASASQLRSALDERRFRTADKALAALVSHSRAAEAGSSGPTWSLLGHVPVLGDDVRAVGTASGVLADLADHGLRPLVEIAHRYDAGDFSPRSSRIPVARIAALDKPLTTSAVTFDRAGRALTGLDGSYVAQVDDAVDELSTTVADGAATLEAVRRAVRLVPPMLGADGARHYLLVLQNNAEIRSTGGFPGSTFVLTADRGRIALDTPIAGKTFGTLPKPAVPLTSDERALFGDLVARRFVDSNEVPDFPQAAKTMMTMWEKRVGRPLDGVVAADPVLLSFLLPGLPPVRADGRSITADNAIEELLSAPYARWTDPERQDAFFRDVASQVFGSLSSPSDPQQVLDAVRRGVRERRVFLVSSHPDEQRQLESAALTGALPDDSASPQIGVYLNDRTGIYGSKLSYYLRAEAAVTRSTCQGSGADRRQRTSGTLTLGNTAPAGGAGLRDYVTGVPTRGQSRGTEGLALIVLGPARGAIPRLELDGQAVEGASVRYDGRPGRRVQMELPPGSTRRLSWTMVSGPGQVGEVEVQVTPGAVDGVRDTMASSSCGGI